jgi:class 3 adenylate cyclase
VNLAARLESHGLPGEIQVAGDLYQALRDSYTFERRGPIAIKGVGTIKTWFLKGENAPQQEPSP